MISEKLPVAIFRCYKSFGNMACFAQSPFLLLVRLYWGWQFVQTGWGKLHNLSQSAGFFASLNLPFPAFTAAFVAWVEFLGGIMLILGLLSRFYGACPLHQHVRGLLDGGSRCSEVHIQ